MVDVAKDLVRFNITDAAIAELKEKYMPLEITDLADKKQFEAVHEARMDCVRRRTDVTKAGKELRSEALEYQKKVIEEEKRIIGMMAPIEDHLTAEEQKVKDEKERLKKLEAEKEAARIQARVDRVCAFGATFDGQQYMVAGLFLPHALLKVANDDQFEMFLGNIQKNVEAEKARVAEEERVKKEEEERQARERDAEAAKLADGRRKLDIQAKIQGLRSVFVRPDMDSARIASVIEDYSKKMITADEFQEFHEVAVETHAEVLRIMRGSLTAAVEKEKVAAEQAVKTAEQAEEARKLQVELDSLRKEKDRLEAEKKAKEDEEKRKAEEIERQKELEAAKREAAAKAIKEAEEKAQKAKEAAERKAARQPDKIKILLIADTLDAIQTPDVKTEDGKAVALAVMMLIAETVKKIRDQVEEEL